MPIYVRIYNFHFEECWFECLICFDQDWYVHNVHMEPVDQLTSSRIFIFD